MMGVHIKTSWPQGSHSRKEVMTFSRRYSCSIRVDTSWNKFDDRGSYHHSQASNFLL